MMSDKEDLIRVLYPELDSLGQAIMYRALSNSGIFDSAGGTSNHRLRQQTGWEFPELREDRIVIQRSVPHEPSEFLSVGL